MSLHVKKLQRIAKKYGATVVVEGHPEEYLVYTDSSTHRHDGSHSILGLGDTKGEAYADAAWRLESSIPCDGCTDPICQRGNNIN